MFATTSSSLATTPSGANNRPINVIAQLLAPDQTLRCALNVRAAFSRNLALPGFPLADEDGRDLELPSEVGSGYFSKRQVGFKVHTVPKFSDTRTLAQGQTQVPRERKALAVWCQIANMRTTDEIRHARLLQVIEELGGERRGMAELARLLGHASTSTLSQYKARQPDSKTGKPKGIGSTAARRIEKACGKAHGWMDTDPSQTSEFSQAQSVEPSAPRAEESGNGLYAPITADEAQVIYDLRCLFDDDRHRIIDEIHDAADRSRKAEAEVLKRYGVAVPDERVAKTIKPAPSSEGTPRRRVTDFAVRVPNHGSR